MPKTYAVLYPERAAKVTARPVAALVGFGPLQWVSRGLIGLTNVIVRGKGLETLVEALSVAAARVADLRLALVGSGEGQSLSIEDELKARVLQGGTDEDILAWCEERSRKLNDNEKLIWNHYVRTLGWNDHISAILAKRKADGGLSDRDDIQTIAHYIDVDEGRLP